MQCDVHETAAGSGGSPAYLLDVQADLLGQLDTRVVAPLIITEMFGRRAGRLHPTFDVLGKQVVMATHLMAAIPRRSLGAAVGSLADQRYTIINAIDVLLSGV
jgi:toxin CcdB